MIAASVNRGRQRILISLGLALPVSFVLALALGTISIPWHETLAVLSGNSDASRASLVIEQIRLPRAILAALVGAILGVTGATTQGLFRNALADPSLIGVTSGASAGAALAIFFAGELLILTGLSGLGLVSLGAFIGGALAVIIVYTLATNQHGTSVATMLLAGIAITALATSLTSLLEFFGDDEMLRRITIWRMGGLDGANYQRVWAAIVGGGLVLLSLPRFATALNALLLGESEARHLGLSVQKIKIQLILLVALGVGVSVALAGTIAFIGLVVPHIVRLLIGPDHRYLLPASAIGGATLLLLSDTVARTVLSPIELPVGLITALLGAPFFISLLRHRRDYGMR
ncbi:ABC transporter permease [Arenicella chitinivorans]|uniref:ABC transporter permease n=1 Tax=Arenicella chitinivorans TaxID=1329800 RepID=A0A918RM35_9GAMM|nr:iron ABC transporter permease [Arenicella chitinivorans]GHA02462.1 ABC transporter permease [Arenicella chitinivorans]